MRVVNLTGWVINLADSLGRMEHARAELERGGFTVARVAASDGRGRAPEDFDGYDDALARRFMGRSLSSGELGCHESHMLALTAFLDSGDDVALIVEDDFHFIGGGGGGRKPLRPSSPGCAGTRIGTP